MMSVVTQYPEYRSTRTQAGVADPERRCLIWERWGVIHVWMETSEPVRLCLPAGLPGRR